MAEGSSSAYGNSADHTPQDIRWMPGRDPSRNWAITRAQPVASLLVAGTLWGFTRSVPPPAELVGKRLIITAGVGHEAFRDAAEDGWAAVAAYCGEAFSPAEIPSGRHAIFKRCVKTLPVGMSVGAVRLAGAFIIDRMMDGKVYANLRSGGKYGLGPGERAMGIWREFDGKPLAQLERITPGRWMWCFDAAHEFDLDFRVKVKGFGGLWDYEKGLKLRGAL